MPLKKPRESAGGVFICGLPRSGTSFLYSVLQQHPQFSGGRFVDKEFRHFEHFLKDRPWGVFDSVPERTSKALDSIVVKEVLATIHRIYCSEIAGSSGRYLIGNPRDIFTSLFLRESIPNARFIVCLRDPIRNVWSMLNHPSGLWGEKSTGGIFEKDNIAEAANHWNKVTSFILQHSLVTDPDFLFIDQNDIWIKPKETFERIGNFLSISGLATMGESSRGHLMHTSFGDERDTFIDSEDAQKKISSGRDSFITTQPGFVNTILEICGANLIKLYELGIVSSDYLKAAQLSRTPARTADDSGHRLRDDLFTEAIRSTIQRALHDTETSYLVQIGANDGISNDNLRSIVQRDDVHAVLVEPTTEIATSLRQLYAKDIEAGRITIREVVCFGDERDDVDFYAVRPKAVSALGLPEWVKGISTTELDHLLSHGLSPEIIEAAFERKILTVTSVNRLLEETNFPSIDVLAIDAEGADYDIVSCLDLNRFMPRIVLFESKFISSPKLTSLGVKFGNSGYKLYTLGNDSIAIRTDIFEEHFYCEIGNLSSAVNWHENTFCHA